MKSKELKQLLVRQWTQLRKPWFGDDPIICRDGDYPEIEKETIIYETLDALAWAHIEKIKLEYEKTFPECEDFSDIHLGRFKEEWWASIQSGAIPRGVSPKYGDCIGYNPDGGMHNFRVYVADGVVWVSDYGQKVRPDGYRPIKVRF